MAMNIPSELDYRCEQSVYGGPLLKPTSLEEVRAHVAKWADIFPDAAEQVAALTEADWPELEWFLRTGARREPRSQRQQDRIVAALDRFGAILLPKRGLQAGLAATQFGAPWGCALIRVLECEGVKLWPNSK